LLSFASDPLVHSSAQAVVKAGRYHQYELLGCKDKLFHIMGDALEVYYGLEVQLP